MTAAVCSRGHESSTMDYCDVCGVPMSRGSVAPAASGVEGPGPASILDVPAAPAIGVPVPIGGAVPADGERSVAGAAGPASQPTPAVTCPDCGAPQVGRFCEEDGYDFLLSPPAVPASTEAAASAVASAVGVPAGADPEVPRPARTGDGTAVPGQGSSWQLVVDADPGYFELVASFGGTDAGKLTFPRFVVPRRFTLERRQLLIGRRSRSRGVHPDVDLVGPPEDPGVSHLHALLVPQSDGWAVVDLESANGTYLNDPSTPPIVANTPIPLGDGDRVYLGAWTRLTIRAHP